MGRLKWLWIYLKGRGRKLDKKKIIGVNVSKFRKIKNLEQSELATKTKLSTDEISKIERGVANPSIETLEKISRELEIDIEELFLERALSINIALSEKNLYSLKELGKLINDILKGEAKKE